MNIFIHSCHTAYTMPLLVAMETVVTSILAHSQSNEFCHLLLNTATAGYEGGERLVM